MSDEYCGSECPGGLSQWELLCKEMFEADLRRRLAEALHERDEARAKLGEAIRERDEAEAKAARYLRVCGEVAGYRDAAQARVAELGAENARLKEGGVGAIAAERQRQVQQEGFDSEHDDLWEHENGELAVVAACYAVEGLCQKGKPVVVEVMRRGLRVDAWPSSHGRRRRLVIAGALIAAEIDRLDREAAEAAGEQKSLQKPDATG